MRSKLRAGTPIIALVFIGIAALFIASCTNDEVEIPDLAGPSGARLFITIEASPDKVFIKKPGQTPDRSRITIQLKNQLGQGVPNAQVALRITNIEGSEVGIGSLDDSLVATDSGGFARVTYTAPSTAEQPANVTVFITAILRDPAFPFEVVTTHPIDLELPRPFDCVAGPGAPVIDFTVNPTTPSEDERVCFDAQATVDNGAIVSFTWSFGDGGTASGVFVCHTFTNDGSFPVTLFVVDNDANCVSLTKLVVVGEGDSPTCVFTTSPTSGITTDTLVRFDASQSEDPDGNIVSFRWDFGDGQSASGETVTHQYANDGTFTVILTVRDNAGNETVCTATVAVGEGEPICDFTVTPPNPNTNEPVTFDGSNSSDPEGGTLTFAWNFGDGNTASGEVVTHTFTSEDNFLVTLTVTDPEGNATTCSDTVIVGSVPPECDFIVSPTSADVGDTVNFTSTSTDDGTITNLRWDFGDGNVLDPNTDPTVSHVYTDEGTFTVILTVTDNDGNTSTCTQTVTIGNALPLCTFTATPNSGTAPLAVAFNASGSQDQDEGGASIVTFAWDFGDGNAETNVTSTTTHTYDETGTFIAELVVTDDEGGSSTCTRTITTTGAVPTASFTATPPSGTLDNQGDPILFDASSSTDNDELGQSIVQYQWDFNDGTAVVITTNPTTTHTFANPGSFSVTLTVTDDEGQTDTNNQTYVVDADGP